MNRLGTAACIGDRASCACSTLTASVARLA
jgi:hypothetical protein